MSLPWAVVNWEHSRLIDRSSKTEHHADGGVRVVPIFGEIRNHLSDVWEPAAEGEEHVVTRYRDPKQNLRTQLNR